MDRKWYRTALCSASNYATKEAFTNLQCWKSLNDNVKTTICQTSIGDS